MATISKQGGRKRPSMRTADPHWQEQAVWLPSVGIAPPPLTLSRLILVGFRNRTIVVKPR